MPRKLIHAINGLLLGVLLIVLPAVISARFRSMQISSAEMLYRLSMVGFAAGFVFNVLLLTVIKLRKSRRAVCVKWACGQLMLGVVYLLMWQDILHFEWLKNYLR